MLIILEGCDGTGKSRLALELQKLIHRERPHDVVTYIHKSAPKKQWPYEYCQPITDWYHPTSSHHMILDRWHWGERVWPEVFERESIMDDYAWNFTEDLLKRNGAIVVLCQQYLDTAKRVITDRGEEFDEKQWRRAKELYLRLEQQTTLPVYKYDWTKSSVDQILDHAKAHQHRVARKLG